ncbi:MAG: hypothetical protein CSA52_03280 [Gammaproteobacteria bacterium]|nr:MAG: hypothetical protein CSB48_04010 [Pseudomonadota bacterium]PIE38217.1 MAG: hypothetical protein CSA52_03280 [Gammaproteobacteria bacterium]
MKKVCITGLICLLQACANVGKTFESGNIFQIESGKTTREQVQQLFGPPWRRGLENGLVTWTYAHYQYSAFNPLRSEDLFIKFDDNGVVKSYTYNTSEDSLPHRSE